jgi:hypothetical protein
VAGPIDLLTLRRFAYFKRIQDEINSKKDIHIRPRKSGVANPPATKANIYVAQKFPEWQVKTMEIVRKLYAAVE